MSTPKARKGIDGNRLTPAREPMTPNREMLPPETPASLRRIKKQLFSSPGTPLTPGMMSPSQTPTRRVRRIIADPNREPMKVYLRVRPLKREEAEKGAHNCIDMENEQSVILRAPRDSLAYRANGGETEARFTFTNVFDGTTSQASFFRATAMPMVQTFLQGTNCLAFAYGVTNAGKTYTIMGSKGNAGLLPRVLDVIFNSINPSGSLVPNMSKSMGRKRKSFHIEESELEYSSSEFDVSSVSSMSDMDEEIPHVDDKASLPVDPNCRYAVWISYVEIYNEKIFDLLEDHVNENARKDLKEDKAGHVFVKGLKEVLISSAEEGHAAIKKGFGNRQKAATLLNQDSSRSHNIITLKLVQIPKDKDPAAIKKDPSLIKYSKLSIIDLAGSERNNRTKTTGARLKEAANINASLMTLGRCMEALRWNQQHSNNQRMIPFRDSKLTRLFQDYFIGNGKAIMIGNASPSSFDYDETCHALKFSALAREVTTSTRIDTGRTRPPVEVDETAGTLLEDNAFKAQEKEHELKEWEEFLKMEREHLDKERGEMEAVIRDEVSIELAQRLEQVEAAYKMQLEQQNAIVEDKYERKMTMFNSMNMEVDETEYVSRSSYEELHQKLEDMREKEEEHQQMIRKYSTQIKSFEKERETLLRQITQLEESFVSTRAEHSKELTYWKDKVGKQLEEKQSLCDSLQSQLDASLKEQNSLSNKLEELSKKTKKGYSSPFSSLGKDRGNKVLHSQIEPRTGDCPAPKNSKIVKTPTKKDLKKYRNYEVMDVQSPSLEQSVASLYKGQVGKSVTGTGVSVVFNDVEVVTRTGLNTSNGSIYESPLPSRRTSGSFSRTDSPPSITLTPPNGQTSLVFDPLQDPTQDAIMQEEDMDEWEDLPLDDQDSKSKKKEAEKEKKERERMQRQVEKEQRERQRQLEKEQKEKEKKTKKQQKIPSSPIKKVFGWKKPKDAESPSTAQDIIDRFQETENEQPENSSAAFPSKRKLFNNNASLLEENETPKKPKVGKTSKRQPLGRTPIAKRLRSAQQTRRASLTRQI